MPDPFRPRRQSRPGATFVVVLLVICALAILSLASSRFLPAGPSTFLQSRSLHALEDESAECREVHKQQDQCAWIQKHCTDEDAGLISYLKLYYCRLGNAKPVGFAIIAAWTALLFSTIGIAASDFFCVNLSTISNILGINENMAGVTFLAFGNGSPDVFSTFAAIRSNSGSLAVGELIGAAGFITAVVSGSMALVRPFKVARKSFIRDVSFFAVSVAFSMVFCANGKLELWECAVMVAYYVFYVIVVVVWHWWLSQRRLRREKHAVARGYHMVAGGHDELEFEGESRPTVDPDETTPLRPDATRHASLDDFVDLERANSDSDDVLEQLDDSQQRQQWLGEINSSMRITQTPVAEPRNISGAIRPSLVGALEFQATLNSIRRSRNIQSIPIHLRRYSDEPAFTLAQQQAHRQDHDAASFISDPESVPPSRGAQTPSLQRSSSDFDTSSRTRARSANAADALQLPTASSRARRHVRDKLNKSRMEPMEGFINTVEEPQKANNQRVSRAPTISINAPDEDVESLPAANEHLPQHSPHHLLAPTSSPYPKPEESEMETQARLPRPRLHITPPSSVPHSKGSSPRLSPFPTLSDGIVSPRASSIVLGPPAIGLNDMTQSPDEMTGQRYAWWPYKYLAPPTEILSTLLPTLSLWHEKNLWGRLIGIAAAPSFLLLTLTLPVVEPEAGEAAPLPSATPMPQSSKAHNTTASFSLLSPALEANQTRSRRASTAHMAVQTEQRHRHSSPLPPAARFCTNGDETALIAPEHPHAAVKSPSSWNRWLVMLQCYTAPYTILLTIWANFYDADTSLLLRPSLICAMGSSVVLLVVVSKTTSTRPPPWHWLLCFVGFAVSITWISTIANEVVGVLKAIGVIFNISDAILGLTIFAVGNSLGDLVADITVARLGFPVMALSACFGGPMLNILLGIGLSGLYMTISGAEKRKHKHPEKGLHFKPYHVEVSTTLLVSAAALLITLLGLLIVVPLNNWKMDRKIGWGLIILWILSTAGNLGVEISGLAELW